MRDNDCARGCAPASAPEGAASTPDPEAVLAARELFCQLDRGEEADGPVLRDAAERLLSSPGPLPEELARRAHEARLAHKGRVVGVQLLTNARSGNCTQDCAYCAQSRRSGADIDAYRWVGDDRLVRDDDLVARDGMSRHCIGLSGMAFTDDEIARLADRIRGLKARHGGSICCSIGFLTRRQAVMLREAGLDRINHNLNTGRDFYPRICTTHTWDQRVANIRMLQDVGFEICCGGIVGMGERPADVADMLMELRALRPQSVPINFLIPIPGTPLGERRPDPLPTDYCLAVLRLARLMVPGADLRCAAGRELYFRGRERELFGVVDSIFAAGYLTAAGQGIADTVRLIEDAGYVYEGEASAE